MLKKGVCIILIIVMVFTMVYSQEKTNDNETLYTKNTQNINNQNIKVDRKSEIEEALTKSQNDADRRESAAKWVFISSLVSCLIGNGGALLIDLAFYPLLSVSLLDGVGATCLITTILSALLPNEPNLDYKLINSSDVYKKVYFENYKKAAILNKIKYSFIGGTISYIFTFGFSLMLAAMLVRLFY